LILRRKPESRLSIDESPNQPGDAQRSTPGLGRVTQVRFLYSFGLIWRLCPAVAARNEFARSSNSRARSLQRAVEEIDIPLFLESVPQNVSETRPVLFRSTGIPRQSVNLLESAPGIRARAPRRPGFHCGIDRLSMDATRTTDASPHISDRGREPLESLFIAGAPGPTGNPNFPSGTVPSAGAFAKSPLSGWRVSSQGERQQEPLWRVVISYIHFSKML